MELLPTSKGSTGNNNDTSRRFRRSSSMPLILTRLVRFPQMDFEVQSVFFLHISTKSKATIEISISLHYGKWLIY